MKLPQIFRVTLAFGVFLAAFPTYGGEQARPQTPGAAQVAKSVTVFPIVLRREQPLPPGTLPAGMSKNMAELVGLFLELGGMKEVEIADTQFSPPDKADLAVAAEAFGRFVESQKLGTEYALYGQFAGMPGTGINEIRLVAVDRQGKVLLSERIDKDQLAKFGEERVDPMSASSQLVHRLQGLWGLTETDRKGTGEGKMAKLCKERSGLPPQNELDAMQPRLDLLKKSLKTSALAVFPVSIGGTGDKQLAGRLAEMLTKEGIGRAEPSSIDPKLQIQPNTNQTRIAWDIARGFREFLRKNPPAADYALMAAYGIGRDADGQPGVAGMEFVLCARNGDWVIVELRNSHHSDYRRINPKSADDGNRLLVEAIKERLR